MKTIKKIALGAGLGLLPVAIMLGIFTNSCTEKDKVNVAPAADKIVEDKGWKFETTPVWSDEFDYTGKPDNKKWGYDVGGGGWGNEELEYYTNGDNADVKNGMLTIEARKENKEGRNYTSARMVTTNLGDWLYGRFEARMKLPKGRGTWPAFWMLPTDYAYGDWPASGEIDIMEHVGYDQGMIHFSAHTKTFNFKNGGQKTADTLLSTASSDFHVYRLDWTPYSLKGYIDSSTTPYFVYNNNNSGFEAWPFDKRYHILLNLAIGGQWGGVQGVDPNIFPCQLVVDYVRVYKIIPQ